MVNLSKILLAALGVGGIYLAYKLLQPGGIYTQSHAAQTDQLVREVEAARAATAGGTHLEKDPTTGLIVEVPWDLHAGLVESLPTYTRIAGASKFPSTIWADAWW